MIQILIPTYNESESIKQLLSEITKLDLAVKILVIDDNSPDGTADLVQSLAYKNVDILRRKEKDGLGNAYKAGIKYVLPDPEITHIVSMDADGSHQVKDLTKLIAKAIENPDLDLILGSRWIPGGSIENWSKHRKWLSKLGTRYARWALKLSINDATGGFRIYSKRILEMIDLEKITSNGYCYQIEMAFAIDRINNSKKIVEVPIQFIEREAGKSKMSGKIVMEAMAQMTRLGLALRLNPSADKLHYVK